MTIGIHNKSHIRINVGGKIFFLQCKTIRKFPNSRLEQICRAINEKEILALCDEYDRNTGECFFDRHSKSFENVWNLLQSGQFYFDQHVCAENILNDLQYWGVSIKHLPFCCRYKYERKREMIEDEYEKVRSIMRRLDVTKRKSKAIFGKWRSKLWNIMEHPETSILARVMAVISIVFIVLSTVCLVVSTVPFGHKTNKSSAEDRNSLTMGKVIKDGGHQENIQNDVFEIIEYICITWFTLEYVLRLISVSEPLQFIKEFMNIIDIIAIAPFFLTLIVTNVYKSHSDKLESISRVVQVFRVLRILRVLKLARHSIGLQSLGYTLQKSYKELGLLVSFIAIGVSLFSSLVYFAEKDTNSVMFPSIPHTFWWAIISMSTVGYGDVFPHSALGQAFASICCVIGVLVVALPIPIIVSNFSEFYKDKLRMEKILKRREDLEKATQDGSHVLNNFAHDTIEAIASKASNYIISRTELPFQDVWNTDDWKFMDYSSSGCESSYDDETSVSL